MSSGWSIDCADIHTLAAAWLDEQLSPAEQELFEAHLESCDACEKFIERLSLQTITPPVIELSRTHDYWAQMDSALVDELDRLEQEQQSNTVVAPQRSLVFALVAVVVLSVLWGWSEHQRAVSLEQQVLHQAQTIEHYERLSAQPSKSSTPSRAPTRSSKRYIPARLDL